MPTILSAMPTPGGHGPPYSGIPFPHEFAGQHTRRPASTRRAGLSLIELLVAIVILSVGVVGVLRAFALATRYNYSAENETAAGLLAHDMLEEIRADGAVSEGIESGTFDGDQSRFAWTRSVRKTEKDELYEVRVTISWPESIRQRDLTLTTLIYVN